MLTTKFLLPSVGHEHVCPKAGVFSQPKIFVENLHKMLKILQKFFKNSKTFDQPLTIFINAPNTLCKCALVSCFRFSFSFEKSTLFSPGTFYALQISTKKLNYLTTFLLEKTTDAIPMPCWLQNDFAATFCLFCAQAMQSQTSDMCRQRDLFFGA